MQRRKRRHGEQRRDRLARRAGDEAARRLDLFRLNEDPQNLIASVRVKTACERHQITGIRFYTPADYPF